jgi:hypothetical protein
MSVLMAGRDRAGLVFTAHDGGQVNYANFRTRVWYPAVAAARLCGKPAPADGDEFQRGLCGEVCDDSEHKVRMSPRG